MVTTPRCRVLPCLLLACLLYGPRAEAQTAGGGTAAQEVEFASGELKLHGFIYRPAGAGPFPAVLWNHGSERLPGWLPELGKFFVGRGYVFMVPHRRGQGRSANAAPYIIDLLQREGQEHGAEARSRKLVELMEIHFQDQLAGLAYLQSLPDVDTKRIAVMGCSFGGIQTMLAAEGAPGIRAAVDFAGGAESWRGSEDLRNRMIRAARNARVPVLFIQAEGDYDLAPSYTLGKEMEKAGRAHALRIYPAFGKTQQENHEFCVRGAEIWGADVLAFLEGAFAGEAGRQNAAH